MLQRILTLSLSLALITGEILWDFSEEDVDFCPWENEYKTMAETVAYLIEPNRRCSSPEEVIDLIETVTSMCTDIRGIYCCCCCCRLLTSFPITSISRIANGMGRSSKGLVLAVFTLRRQQIGDDFFQMPHHER